jgi:hypothetical protein
MIGKFYGRCTHPSRSSGQGCGLPGGRATQGREFAAMELAIRENYTGINFVDAYSENKNY